MTTTLASAPSLSTATHRVSIRGFVKRFGQLVAVDDVDVDVEPGIYALIGENGAGKSTLVKALYGFDPPDRGEVLLDGRRVVIRSPRDARALGLGMLFQQSNLIPAFSVAENIALHLPGLPVTLRWHRIGARISELSDHYGLRVVPAARAGDLSVPELQRVEIVRLLLTGARILIFDEPTSTLPPQEIESLLAVFRRLRDEGYTIIFITHKLHEVLDVADVVTVMRLGKVVGSLRHEEVTESRLIGLMFHEEAHARPKERERGAAVVGEPVLELRGVTTQGEVPLQGLDLVVRAGEMVGVAGISGEGQRELGDVAVGMAPLRAGRRLLCGKDATRWSVRRLRDAGLAYVPEDVGESGVIWNMTLDENVALANLTRVTKDRVGIDWHAVKGQLAREIAELGVELPSSDRRAHTLSGGNLQRFTVARELARSPKLLVALYPTRGLDAVTAEHVRELLVAAANRGTGVLLVSQDLSELETLCDRVVVLRGGRLVAERAAGEADAYELGRLMTGDDG